MSRKVKWYTFLWKAFLNNKFEILMSLTSTLLIVLISEYIGFYNNFEHYIEMLNNLIICIIGCIFAAIGFSLSGIAIISSLFTSGDIKRIEKYSGKGKIKKLLSYYYTLSKNLGINTVILILYYFIINSMLDKTNKIVFWLGIGLTLFYTLYNMFYMISLVNNCIKLYEIKNQYDNIQEYERNIIDDVNEVRIDFLFKYLMENSNENLDDLCKKIIELIDTSEYDKKEEMIKYIEQCYKE